MDFVKVTYLDIATAEEQRGYKEPPSKRHWLSYFLFKLLVKLGKMQQYGMTEKVYQFGPGEQKNALDGFYDKILENFERGYDPNEYLYFMGEKEFHEMTKLLASDVEGKRFPIEAVHLARGHSLYNFRSLTFSVVGGMSGYCMIHKCRLPYREDFEGSLRF